MARAAIAEYIDAFYNPIRRHSHLGGVSPEAFEAAFAVDLDQTRLGRRRPAWILAGIVLLFGLVLPFAVDLDALPWWTSDDAWSSGPLLPAHALLWQNEDTVP